MDCPAARCQCCTLTLPLFEDPRGSGLLGASNRNRTRVDKMTVAFPICNIIDHRLATCTRVMSRRN